MVTSSQLTEMHKLVQNLASMDLPDMREIVVLPPGQRGSALAQRAVDDASALYDLIEQAREILKKS